MPQRDGSAWDARGLQVRIALLAGVALLLASVPALLAVWRDAVATPPEAVACAASIGAHPNGIPGDAPPADGLPTTLMPAPEPDVDAIAAARSEAPFAGVFGVVFDDLGEPLAHASVWLRSREVRAKEARTDQDGRFAFRDAHGDLLLLVPALVPGQPVTLAPGERRVVDLHAGTPCIRLEVAVRLGDQPIAGRALWVDGSEPSLVLPILRDVTDEAGLVRGVVPPGRYRLQVAGPDDDATQDLITRAGGRSGRLRATGDLVLSAQQRRVRHEVALPVAELHVTVVAAATRMQVAGAIVRLGGGDSGASRKQTGADGGVVFPELPAGRYTVAIASEHAATPREHAVVVADARWSPPPVRFEVVPIGHLHVVLREPDGTLIEPLRADGASLREATGTLHHGEVARLDRVGVRFAGVPEGRHTLSWNDVQQVDGWAYAPTDAVLQPVQVRAGKFDLVEVTGVRRPRLRVIARDRAGRERAGDLVVTGPQGVVRSALPFFSGWASFVPPGEYTLRLRTADGAAEERLQVTKDVEHTFRAR